MEFEEVVQAALGGDVDAMCAVGNAHFQNNDVREASEWFERAADAGSRVGRMLAMMGYEMDAIACEIIGDYKDALASRQKSFYFMNEILGDEEESDDNMQKASDIFSSTMLGIGGNMYVLGQKEDAVTPLELAAERGELMAKVFLGLYYITTATAQDGYASARKGVQFLETFFRSDFTFTESSRLHQGAVHMGHCMLATAYRVGLGGSTPDNTKAYECLLHLQAQNLKYYAEEVREELAKYKKGLLGGYKYIG